MPRHPCGPPRGPEAAGICGPSTCAGAVPIAIGARQPNPALMTARLTRQRKEHPIQHETHATACHAVLDRRT